MKSNYCIRLLATLIISGASALPSCLSLQTSQAIRQSRILSISVAGSNRRYSRSGTVMFGRRGGDKGGGGKKKRVSKENLPEKICVVCERPFTWRKKWERDWDNITCCSKACNAKRRAGPK